MWKVSRISRNLSSSYSWTQQNIRDRKRTTLAGSVRFLKQINREIKISVFKLFNVMRLRVIRKNGVRCSVIQANMTDRGKAFQYLKNIQSRDLAIIVRSRRILTVPDNKTGGQTIICLKSPLCLMIHDGSESARWIYDENKCKNSYSLWCCNDSENSFFILCVAFFLALSIYIWHLDFHPKGESRLVASKFKMRDKYLMLLWHN